MNPVLMEAHIDLNWPEALVICVFMICIIAFFITVIKSRASIARTFNREFWGDHPIYKHETKTTKRFNEEDLKGMGELESFEIYYRDLNEEAKERYLKFQRVENESELNDDLCPLAIVDVEFEEDVGNGN